VPDANTGSMIYYVLEMSVSEGVASVGAAQHAGPRTIIPAGGSRGNLSSEDSRPIPC
jgi:hypothetical protein